MRHIIDAALAQHWAIQPDALTTLFAIAERRSSDMDAVLAARGDKLAGSTGVVMRDGVAVLAVRGPIFRYANLFTDVSGASSIDVLAQDFGAAVSSPAVRAIVLEIDSPGGMVAGISEFASQVRAATAVKPVTAYVSDLGASAAYWIAAAAGEMVISNTSKVGSIGVVMRAYREREDGAIKFVSAQSPRKQASPDSDLGQVLYQSEVDALAGVFISAIATYRGVSPDRVANDFGQGHVLIGASAVAAGMADRLGSLEAVIAGLAGTSSTRTGSESSMIEQTQRAVPFSEDAARAEYRASPALQREFGEERIYVAYARSFAALGDRYVCGQRGDTGTAPAPAPSPPSTSNVPPGEPASADEQACRAEYDRDATLREDFPTFKSYLAYARAYHAGHVRIVGQNRNH